MATSINDADVRCVIGAADRLVVAELVRTRASRDELAAAFAFASGPTAMSAAAYRALGSRMQRLVDLLSVALPGSPAAGARRLQHA